MLEVTREALQRYLQNNLSEAVDVAREMNSYDGGYEWVDAWDFDELCAIAADSGKDAVDELVRACVYGGGTYGGMVRYNAYGNLVSGEQDDLEFEADNYLIDILSGLEEYIDDDGTVNHIYLSDDVQKIIEESLEGVDLDED